MCLLVAGVLLTLAPAQARPGGLPFITGGGRATNNNSGGEQQGYGGFVARAVAEENADGFYPAEGEVQARSATTADHETVVKVHGDVVCIANLGPAGDNDAGGNPAEDVWEIRFQIERSDPPGLEGFYASLFVQDNGRDDYIDENANPMRATQPNCGEEDQFQLEELQGQVTVHD